MIAMKKIIKTTLILFVTLVFTGCDLPIAKYERLKHVQTENFYNSNNLSFLKEFKIGDLYFSLEPKKIASPGYIIWFGAYSKIPDQSVKINSAKINSEKVMLESKFQPIILNPVFKEKRSLHSDSLKLFELGNEDSQKLQDSEDIKLELYYQVAGEAEQIMIFDIKSYYYYDIAWST